MARKPRVHYAGAIYHVIARGNNREIIFLDPYDKQKYLEFVVRYKKRYNYEILAYVLMDNHLHILIRVDPLVLQHKQITNSPEALILLMNPGILF